MLHSTATPHCRLTTGIADTLRGTRRARHVAPNIRPQTRRPHANHLFIATLPTGEGHHLMATAAARATAADCRSAAVGGLKAIAFRTTGAKTARAGKGAPAPASPLRGLLQMHAALAGHAACARKMVTGEGQGYG